MQFPSHSFPAPNPVARPVLLALQGGGSHGAFQWGVLDRLLEHPGLTIMAVSGASAGAMNAAMLVQGLATGGVAEAKRLLSELWRRVAAAGGSLDLDLAPWPWSVPGAFELLRRSSRVPPQLGVVLGLNPLRSVLQDLLDPAVFGRPGAPAVVVSATRVTTGEARLFCDGEVSVDALLASACLPQIFSAVEIDGEAYWDGGYSANPPLRPLIELGGASDIVLVRTGPADRPQIPRNGNDVLTRSTELAFACALREELRSLADLRRLLPDDDGLPAGLSRLRDTRLHMIEAEEAFRGLRTRSKLDATWSFLRELHLLGRRTAEEWLKAHAAALGERSTLDLARFATPALRRGPAPRSAADGSAPRATAA